jgi:hypothetical protein
MLTIRIPRNLIVSGEFKYPLLNHKFSGVPVGVAPTIDHIFKEIHFMISVEGNNLDEITEPTLGEMKIAFENDIFFSEINGLLINYRIDYEVENPITYINVDYPINIENVMQINGTTLTIVIDNYIGFDAEFYATITARNTRSDKQHTVNTITSVKTATIQGTPTQTTILYSDDVEDLLNIAPDQLEISNAYFIIHNPDDQIGFAKIDYGFNGNYSVKAPFKFSIKSTDPIRPDNITSTDISKKNREHIEKYTKAIELNVNLANYFPLNASIDIFICNSPDMDLLFIKEDHFGDFQRVVLLDNRVEKSLSNQAGLSKLTIPILENQIPIFYTDKTIYFGIEISFVDIDESDDIEIKIDDRIDVTINMLFTAKLEF